MKFSPMRHQQLAYDFCIRRSRAGLMLGMGLGPSAKQS